MRYPEHRLNEVAFRARLYDLNHVPLAKGIGSIIKRVPKVVPYDNDARDADGDGLVQEGTIWERPSGTRWISKLGSALISGLRAIPSNSKLIDADGNDVDYKPGDKAQGGRAKLRGLLARRRLRRAGRRRSRAEGRRDEDAERAAPDSFDKLIETLENAANAASQERLIEAEKARGDGPMNAEYRTFWDQFLETFTGINQRQHKNPRDKARSKSAIRKALGMEGNRRTAGDENGNAPDRDREREFDEEALDGKGVMPSAIEEHHRKLDEDPEYRKRWNRALREGRIDQFIEKEGLRPKLVDPEERRPGGVLPEWEPPSPDRRPRGPRWPRLPGGGRRPRPRPGEERVDVDGVTWVYDGPLRWVEFGPFPDRGPGYPTGRGGSWLGGWKRKRTTPSPVPEDRDVPEPKMDEVDAPEVPEADAPEAGKPGLGRMTDDELQARIDELIDINDDMATDDLTPEQHTELESLEFERNRRQLVDGDLSDEVVESIEHYRDTVLPELDDEELAQELAELRDSLTSGEGREFPNNDGAERFALALQEQRRRLVESRDAPEADAPDEAEEREEFTPWDDDTLANSSNEEIGRRITELVAMDPIGRDRESAIGTELERLMQEDRRRSEARGGGRPWPQRLSQDEIERLSEEQVKERISRLMSARPPRPEQQKEVDAEIEELRAWLGRMTDGYEFGEDLPGDQFYDNTDWIDGSDPWNDDAIDSTIQVALATDDTGVIEGIERSLQWFKDDMTASEWRGAKGRRHREIQEMLDLNRILDRRRRERAGATGADDEVAQGRSLLNNLDDWDDQKLAHARDLAYRLSRAEGNDPESREKRELSLLLQHRIDNDGRDRTGMWQVGEPHTPEGDAPEADVPEGDAPESRVPGGLVEDLSDEELNAQIDELENIDIEDLSRTEERRLEALGDEHDRRFGTEEEQDQAREDMDLEERLEWYETDPETLSDEELQTEINELNSEEDLDEHAMEWLTKLSNEDERRADERDHQDALDERQAAEDEEERRTGLVEGQQDPQDMSPEEMAEEMDAISAADDDELAEHWGSSEAAMDRHNALQDALSEREERDAADAEREEQEDRVAEQEDPTGMRDEDIGEEMSELFEITQDEDYAEEAREEAQDRWNLLSVEQDRRERETEQDERDLSEALDERQAEEDAEEDRIREVEEQERDERDLQEALDERQAEEDERQIRVEEHDGNPPNDLSEEDLANEIAELSDSEIMDDIDSDRLTDLENEVERRMEVAATREDENRGERSRSLRARSVESLQEELDELLDDPDSDEDRIDAIDMELKRRKQRGKRNNRRRTNRRTDELEEDEEEYEGEGEGGEEDFVVPDRGSDDDESEGEEGGEALDPYAQMEQDMAGDEDDEPEPSPQPVSAETEEDPAITAWREEFGDSDPQFADMTHFDIENDLYENYTERSLTPEEVERAMALSEELTRRRAHPRYQGGSGPDGEWTDADEAEDPSDRYGGNLEDFLAAMDADIYDGMTAVYDTEEDAKAAQEYLLGKLIRRDELLEEDLASSRPSMIGVHREMMRNASDEEILALLNDEEYWDREWADEHGVTRDALYDNNQKYLNAFAEAEKRGLLEDTVDPTNAERTTPDEAVEAALPDPLEGKTPEVAEAEEAIRRDWDGYSPQEKEYLAFHFLDTEIERLEQGLTDMYRGKSVVTFHPLPDDATPEMIEIRAMQESFHNAKEALYRLLAQRDMSGTLGGVEHASEDRGDFVKNIAAKQILAAHIFNKLDQADLGRVKDALNSNTNMVPRPLGVLFMPQWSRMEPYDDFDNPEIVSGLVELAVTRMQRKMQADGTVVTDEQVAEAVSIVERDFAVPLGEAARDELDRRIRAMGSEELGGTADPFLLDLILNTPSGIGAMNQRNSFIQDLWSVRGRGITSADLMQLANVDAPNLGRGMSEIGRLAVEDLGLTGRVPSGAFSNPDLLIGAIISTWSRQLHLGEIDEATLVSNLKNLHYDLAKSYKKHAAAGLAIARTGPGSRIHGPLANDLFGNIGRADQASTEELFSAGVKAGMFISAQKGDLRNLALDGVIDVQMAKTETDVISGLIKDLRGVSDMPVSFGVTPEGGSTAMRGPLTSGNRGKLTPVQQQAAGDMIERAAELLFPDDWIELSNSSGEVILYRRDRSRASFGSRTTIGLDASFPEGVGTSEGAIDVTKGSFSLADAGHEFTHRMQSVNIMLLLHDDAFARRRQIPVTEAEKRSRKFALRPFASILGRSGMAGEKAIEDHFSMPYMGKLYDARRGKLRLEVSSVGIEILLGGSVNASARPVDQQHLGPYTLAEALAEDRSKSWIGHVLAMLIGV